MVKNMKKINQLFLLICVAALVSACTGWKLRGSNQALELTQQIYLTQASGEVYQQLKNTFSSQNILAETLSSAEAELALGTEYFERRSLTIDSQAQTTQYQLSISLDYELLDSEGEHLINTSRAEISRYYEFDKNAITSSDKEEQTLRKEMVQQLSRQIIQRLQFVLNKGTP